MPDQTFAAVKPDSRRLLDTDLSRVCAHADELGRAFVANKLQSIPPGASWEERFWLRPGGFSRAGWPGLKTGPHMAAYRPGLKTGPHMAADRPGLKTGPHTAADRPGLKTGPRTAGDRRGLKTWPCSKETGPV